jgi:hypothetical protein
VHYCYHSMASDEIVAKDINYTHTCMSLSDLCTLTLGSLEMTPRPEHGASSNTLSKPPIIPGIARPS